MKRADARPLLIFLVGVLLGAGIVGAVWIATRSDDTGADVARAYATAIVRLTPGAQLKGVRRIGASLWEIRVRNRTGTEKCALMNTSRLTSVGPGGTIKLPMVVPTDC